MNYVTTKILIWLKSQSFSTFLQSIWIDNCNINSLYELCCYILWYYVSVLKSGSSPHIKYNSEIDFICQRNKSWLYILLQSESFFTFFRGRNQRCMNQNQFWCQNVFKDVKLSNLIFPLVRVRQTYRNFVECFRLIKLIRLAFIDYE